MEFLYVCQALLIGGLLLFLSRHQPVLIRIQILIWTVGVIVLALRFGISGQLVFYSNDQVHYAEVVSELRDRTAPFELTWWLGGSRIPYSGAALPLAWAGIYVPLALKTVSLVSLLYLSKALLERTKALRFGQQLSTAYYSGCGVVGVFFSLLALRETMMMLFVYRFVLAGNLSSRVVLLALIALLRPHLALVLFLGELLLCIWDLPHKSRRIAFLLPITLIVIGISAGKVSYNWRVSDLGGSNLQFVDSWSLHDATRIASNFVGLQFLTNEEWNVSLSIGRLFLLRTVFSETIVIPSLFMLLIITQSHRLTRTYRLALLAFAMYISIATNTDFNSFRQNLPFMPILGVVIIELLARRDQDESRPKIPSTALQFNGAETAVASISPPGT